MELTKTDIKQLNDFERFFSYIPTWAFGKLINLANKRISLFTGNQALKTSSVAYQYVFRILGLHPIPKKNVLYFECVTRTSKNPSPHGYYEVQETDKIKLRGYEKGTWNVLTRPKDNICTVCGEKIRIHKRKSKIFRFAAESLPTDKNTTGTDGQSTEVRNSVYPEFKKWLPDFLIRRDPKTGKRRDITVRNPAISICDPWDGEKFGDLEYNGTDIVVEFMSYNQAVAAGAGVQRMSCWMDEEAPMDFDEEQGPRLIAEDGDKIDTLTPANRMTWTYDSLFENACLYVRTQAVCDFLSKERPTPRIEQTGSDMDIAVIQAATDDNPTLSKEAIDAEFNIHDPDGVIIPTRRYGIFKQATGRIFKDFNPNVHIINPKKFHLSTDVLVEWVLARSEDFHTKTPLAIIWVALSPQNEAFVWQEWSPSPDKWVTDRICEEVAKKSGKMNFVCNLIDPLANSSNNNTGKTTVEEMNKKFYELKHEGSCTGGYWEPYNTKGNVGRDDITTRLQNSVKVGQPFNNIVLMNGIKKQLPTLWVFNECHEMARSLKHWRRESWANSRQLVTKEQKETPAQRFSHFCTALEGLFKDKRFRPRTRGTQRHRDVPSYFKAGAR